MPWISSAGCWPRYQFANKLRAILQDRGFPLLTMPAEELPALELPSRCLAEVYPKMTLALLSPTLPLKDRPAATQFQGQLDDWLFPRLFEDGRILEPAQACLPADIRLRLSPGVIAEASRIAALRRPFPRREPLRAFVAAFQGILTLLGGGCFVGAPGVHEGSILLPAIWHPDWEAEWSDPRGDKRLQPLRRIPVLPASDDRLAYPDEIAQRIVPLFGFGRNSTSGSPG